MSICRKTKSSKARKAILTALAVFSCGACSSRTHFYTTYTNVCCMATLAIAEGISYPWGV